MRERYQKGSLKKVQGKWIGQWREDGHRRKRVFGRVSKSEARAELDEILAPINAAANSPSTECPFNTFVENTFLPWHERRWKRSTIMTNKDRINFHLLSEFGTRPLGSFTRDDLQAFLDRKAKDGLSYSVVGHLRWDLRQVFGMAVAEGYLSRNPAAMLFTPRDAKTYEKRVMTIDEVRICFTVLDLRERLIVKTAILAGPRPGEILGLRWGCVVGDYADIRCRMTGGMSILRRPLIRSVAWLSQAAWPRTSENGDHLPPIPAMRRGSFRRRTRRCRSEGTTSGGVKLGRGSIRRGSVGSIST